MVDFKNKFFSQKASLNCGGRLLTLDQPRLMFIINLNPDSFYKASSQNHQDTKALIDMVAPILEADDCILDLGASSSRPGAELNNSDQEWRYLEVALKDLRKAFPNAFISIDTVWGETARRSLENGADIINDISAFSIDASLLEVVAQYKCPYILMHMPGRPSTMQSNTDYENVVEELQLFFFEKLKILKERSVMDVILDPGLGFGKSLEQNFLLLKKLKQFQIHGCPVLVGASRKSMIYKTLKGQPETSLNGTTVLNTLALANGASILRVHDAMEAQEVIQLFKAYQEA